LTSRKTLHEIESERDSTLGELERVKDDFEQLERFSASQIGESRSGQSDGSHR
jgi:hypothetical protein